MNRVQDFATAIDDVINRFSDELNAYEIVGIMHMAAAAVEAAALDGQVTVIVACAEKELKPIWEGISGAVQ